jgi:hypothetical protein
MSVDDIPPRPDRSQPSPGGGMTVPFGIIGMVIGMALGFAYTRVTGYG